MNVVELTVNVLSTVAVAGCFVVVVAADCCRDFEELLALNGDGRLYTAYRYSIELQFSMHCIISVSFCVKYIQLSNVSNQNFILGYTCIYVCMYVNKYVSVHVLLDLRSMNRNPVRPLPKTKILVFALAYECLYIAQESLLETSAPTDETLQHSTALLFFFYLSRSFRGWSLTADDDDVEDGDDER